MQLFTHLNFPGNCEQAFRYYEQHLGGKILAMMKQSHAPGAPKPEGPDPVIHARLALGNTVLIGNDVPPDHLKPIHSVYLYLSVGSVEEAERIYPALTANGQVYAPLKETPFASRFSQLRDQFGILWTLIHERPAP